MAHDWSRRVAADGWIGATMRRVLMTWAEQRDHLPATPAGWNAVATGGVPTTLNTGQPSVTTTVIVLSARERRTLWPCE